jgi:hypothetical protein
MKRQTKLDSAEQQQQAAAQQAQKTSALEFATPEQMLRHDAAHTEVPASIARRLEKSIGAPAGTKPSWWRRLFGDSNP